MLVNGETEVALADLLRHVVDQLFQKRGILDGGSQCD
jgi:hypothetical protein